MDNGMEAEMSVDEFKEWSLPKVTPKVEIKTDQRIGRIIRAKKFVNVFKAVDSKKNQPWSKTDDKVLREMFQGKKSDKKNHSMVRK